MPHVRFAPNAAGDFDEGCVEASPAELDNAYGSDKQKVRRKSRGIKVPMRGSNSKQTSKDSSVQESQQEKLQQNRTFGDASTQQPKKKLTRNIRQKRMQDVKALLERPEHAIDRMKLSVAHLRLLQEATESAKGKEIPSGPSSSNQSSQHGDTIDFDSFWYDELDNYDNDRTESYVPQNITKLNYHSYMNKGTRTKWSKSDTELFYQGLQQFGSDFAMIQQLFPHKTHDQVQRKFKTEEKRHPVQVHDAVVCRLRDNFYFKQVVKQLNIEDVQPGIYRTHEQEIASNQRDHGGEIALDGFNNENVSVWSDKENGAHISDVTEGEHVAQNDDDDDLDNVFDWY